MTRIPEMPLEDNRDVPEPDYPTWEAFCTEYHVQAMDIDADFVTDELPDFGRELWTAGLSFEQWSELLSDAAYAANRHEAETLETTIGTLAKDKRFADLCTALLKKWQEHRDEQVEKFIDRQLGLGAPIL